ncbi:hypothetical protein BC830DRAFT_1143171 [Chytriomyces sp. MP71]|nr:hypothetical protein BC830DRAFT_1143171 [Chytriomyces sp. MP71]
MEDDEHDYPAGYAHDPEDEDDPDYYAEDEYHLDDDEQDVDDEYYDKEQEWYGSESYSHDSSQELVAALREETRKLSEELAQSRDEMKRTLGQIKTRLGKVAKSVKRKRELEGVAEEEGQLGGQVEEVEVQESIAKRTKFHNKCEKGYPFVADVVWTLGSAAVGAVLGVAAVGMIC